MSIQHRLRPTTANIIIDAVHACVVRQLTSNFACGKVSVFTSIPSMSGTQSQFMYHDNNVTVHSLYPISCSDGVELEYVGSAS
jgi:hypothetical protein